MEIIIADKSGLCYGVRRALQLAHSTRRRRKGRVQTLGELIHNPMAIADLEKKEIQAVRNPSSIREGTVIIRSHGVAPTVYRALEKKRIEILQMSVLNPKVAILDETDSGLDIDALKTVAEGINKYHNEQNGVLMVTHYQRLLNYIKPNFVHVMMAGKLVKSGGPELALKLEDLGYDWVEVEVAQKAGV